MRARAVLAASLAAGAGVSLAGAPLRAGNQWDGGGGNNDWGTSNNWNPNGAPVNDGTAAITFSGSTRLTPNLNTSRSILSLTFDNTAGAFSLNTSSASVLTIGTGGIAQNDADTQTITHALTLGGSQTWNSNSGALVVTGSINLGANTLTATTTAATATTYSGAIVGASGSLTKNGANTLVLGGASANTYTGVTTVNAGVLQLGKSVANGAIAGNLTIGDGTGTDTVRLAASHQITDAATVTLATSAVFDLQTFSETIANLTLTGAQVTGTTGTLVMSGALTHNAAATSATIGGMTLQIAGGNKIFTVADGAAGVDLDITGVISQDIAGRSITKSGAGLLRLAGANTYSGGLNANAGTVVLASNAAGGAGTLTLGGATIKPEGARSIGNAVTISATTPFIADTISDSATFSGAIGGSGALNITNASNTAAFTLELSGAAANTHNGVTTVNSGLVRLNKTAGTNAIGGNLTIGDSSTATKIAEVEPSADNQIADGATVTVRRSGLWDLASGNRSETIAALVLEDADLATGAGTLTVNGPITATNALAASTTISGNLNLGGGTRTITASNVGTALTISSTISNGGISAQGGGPLKLSGSNTFAGGFEHASTGVVDAFTNSALGSGVVSTQAGATRVFTTTSGGARTLANNFTLDGTAEFTFSALNSMTLSGTISGPGGLNAPDGGLTLSGVGNSYGGVTAVGNGVDFGSLRVLADGALGSTAAGTVVSPLATLLFGTTYLTPEPVTISGLGTDNIGAVFLSNVGTTFAGPISLAEDSMITANFSNTRYTGAIATNGFPLTIRGNSLGGGGFGTVAGPIGGGGDVTIDQSVVFENANNTYGGATTINGALRTVGVGFDNIPDASAVTLANAANAALRLDGGDAETIGSLAGGGGSGGNLELIADAHLTTGGNNASTTFAGNISDPSFTTGGRLTKTGSGTMTLAGTNTYRGATTVTGGTLRLLGGAAVGDLSAVTLNNTPGATLDVQAGETIGGLAGGGASGGNVTLGSGVTLTVAGGGTYGGTISGASAGGLTKSGVGTLVLTGANVFAGAVTVNGGTLRVQNGAAIADTVAVSTANVPGVIFDVGNDETIGGLSGGGASGGSVTLSGGSLTINGGGAFNGVISGAGNLTKGAGSDLTLGAVNTYTGKTTVNGGGRVGIVTDSGLGAVPGVFTADAVTLDNGTLQTNAAGLSLAANRGVTIGSGGGTLRGVNNSVFTVASKLTGTGNLTLSTNGSPATPATVTLNGVNTTFTGKTTVDGAVLAVAQDANLSAAPGGLVTDKLTLVNGGAVKATATFSLSANRGITINNSVGTGGALDVDGGQTLTVPGPITGAGNLTKKGPGTLTLSAASSTLTGKTIIDGGQLTVSQDANLGTPPAGLVTDHLTINAATLRWTSTTGIAANRGVRLGSGSSTINVDPGATLTVNAPVNGPGGLTKTGSGTLSLFGTNTYAASTSVGSGRIVLNTSFNSGSSIAVSAGATLELAQVPVATVKATSITATGKVDVKNDKLILTAQPIGTLSGSTYTGVTGMIQSAFNAGLWNGNGLTTTMPDAMSGLTSLGVATADQAGYAGGTFGGLSVAAGNVLVMYTYAGDANLDGFISGDDYAAIDFNIAVPNARGWYNGDFNYDGIISGDDYAAIDFNIVAQGAPFPVGAGTSSAGPAGVTPVPEPSAGVVAAGLLMGSVARRRRSSR